MMKKQKKKIYKIRLCNWIAARIQFINIFFDHKKKNCTDDRTFKAPFYNQQ